MAYSNGIFHINLVSGSDAARTALTACTAANPSGTITRITKTAHGLTTGAIVGLTLFTAWLNSAWKITVVDANNFDLDEAVWQATADNNGTVTPRGGSSWADAWLSITAGATAARIQPGDEFRISKTPDPVSLGQNATFTNGSINITLSSALTKKVEDAISGWTASANITLATNASRKIGATAMTITPAAAFTTGKMCFKLIDGGGVQDFSGYTHINLWIRPLAATAIAANTFRLSLCSDATGDTPVASVNLPAIVASTNWQLIVIDTGSALPSTVTSVSISAIVDPGTSAISVNNIFASNANLNLKSLVGKSGDVNYNIQSINGTTIAIDATNTAIGGRGYSGTTSTETIFTRQPFDVSVTAAWQAIQEAGNSATQYSHYSGGWDTVANVKNGQTVIASTISGAGTFISLAQYVKLSNFTFARGQSVLPSALTEITDSVFCGCTAAFSTVVNADSIVLRNCKFLNNAGTAVTLGVCIFFYNCDFRSNATSGVTVFPGNRFFDCVFANNGSASIVLSASSLTDGANALLRNCDFQDATQTSFSATNIGWVWSYNHDVTSGNHWGFTASGTVNWQTVVKQGSDPGAWKFSPLAQRTFFQPLIVKIAEVACAASSLVTVKVWMQKDNSTTVGGSIFVEDAQSSIAGVVASEVTKANDTSWEELTLTFTPTEAGIVPIFAKGWYISAANNIYVGSITVTQA